MGIIFDLDQTLVDTSLALDFRKSKQWKKVHALIPQFILYDGFKSVFDYLSAHKIKFVIVTSSPSNYCEAVVRQFSIPCHSIVGYHDTNRRKPYPDPILKGIERLGLPAKEILSFGDDPKDIQASKSAFVASAGCMWGCVERQAMISAAPDYIIEAPSEIIPTIKEHFDLV